MNCLVNQTARFFKRPAAALAAALMLLAVACPPGSLRARDASAADLEDIGIAPIVVTAEKRAEEITRVPVSMTAIGAEQIVDERVESIADLSLRVPNMFVSTWGSRSIAYVYVRGVGAVNNDPAVSFNVDGVNYSDLRVFNSGLYDLERIEVLRGPQGTLYGRNSLGGVVNIVTKRPGDETRFGFGQSVGRYNDLSSTFYLRTPVVGDKLYFGLSGERGSRDGYVRDENLGRDVDYRENYNLRTRLRFTPTERIDVEGSFDFEKVRDGAYPLQDLDSMAANPRRTSFDHPAFDRRLSRGGSLRVGVGLDALDVVSITAHRDFANLAGSDQDFSPLDFLRTSDDYRDKQFTQELRFSSPDDPDSTFKWLLGFYYFRRVRDEILDYEFGPAFAAAMSAFEYVNRADSTVKNRGAAVFGQATKTFGENFDLTLGLRYEHERSDVRYFERNIGDAGGVPVSSIPGFEDKRLDGGRSDSELLPKIQLDYRLSERLMVYGSAARGFRSGGFNTSVNSLAASEFGFGPEHSMNYELGFKSSLWGGRLRLSGAVFSIDIRDQQVVRMTALGETVVQNAGRSQSRGLELEASALLGAGFELEAGLGLARARYRRYEDPVLGLDYAGNHPALTPGATYSLSLQHTLPVFSSTRIFGSDGGLSWVNRADLRGVGPFYWDDANTNRESGYVVVNFSTGLRSDNLSLTFFVRNLFDKKYDAVSFAHQLFPSPLAELGPPRTFGASLRADF